MLIFPGAPLAHKFFTCGHSTLKCLPVYQISTPSSNALFVSDIERGFQNKNRELLISPDAANGHIFKRFTLLH